MSNNRLETLRKKNKELKEAQEIASLEKENEHLECVKNKVLPNGTPITCNNPTVGVLAKAEAKESDEERGKYLIEVLCMLSPEEIEKLSYEEFTIYRDIVQSFF